MERFLEPIESPRSIAGVVIAAMGIMMPLVSYAYITPGEFLGESSSSSSSSVSSSSSSQDLPIPNLDLGGSNAGDLPVPNLDLGGSTAGDLPIPCINYDCLFPAAGSGSSSSVSSSSSSSSSSVSTSSSSSSTPVGTTNGGGSGIDPNYVIYGKDGSPTYPYPYPVYPYPPYQPYYSPYPAPNGGVIPYGTPTLTPGGTGYKPGVPLSNTGPGEMLAFTVFAASAIYTYKRARRAEARAIA